MMPQPPPGQGPINPNTAFAPPPGVMPPGPYPFPQGAPMPYPPQMMPMPMVMQPRRGFSMLRLIGAALLLVLLVDLVLLNLMLGVASIQAGEPIAPQQTTVLKGSPLQKVAVIPVEGIIDGQTAQQIDWFLDNAEKDNNVKALVVEIDSPGGEVTASDEIYQRILDFKSKKNVPVVVSMGSIAASGGYYVACAGDHIYAQPTTLTGSIGVIMPSLNFSKLMKNHGVEDNSIVAGDSKFKAAGSPYTEMTSEQKLYLKALADQMLDRFKSVVAKGRTGKISKQQLDQIANGRVFPGPEAKLLGLVDDDTKYRDDAYQKAAALAGLNQPTVTRYHELPPVLMDFLLSKASAPGKAQSGININVDANFLRELSDPRPLYLYQD